MAGSWSRIWEWLRSLRRQEAAHLALGRWGERCAERFLRRKGYRIVGRRIRVGAEELDLIALHENTLIFVEVKTRSSDQFGRPADAVNRAKQYRICRAAIRYARRLRDHPRFARFDVVEVVGHPGDRRPLIHHVENAFTLTDTRMRWPW